MPLFRCRLSAALMRSRSSSSFAFQALYHFRLFPSAYPYFGLVPPTTCLSIWVGSKHQDEVVERDSIHRTLLCS